MTDSYSTPSGGQQQPSFYPGPGALPPTYTQPEGYYGAGERPQQSGPNYFPIPSSQGSFGPYSVAAPQFTLPPAGGPPVGGAYYTYENGEGSLALWSPFVGLEHPAYTSGAPITGTLTLHLKEDERLEDIHVKVRGVIRTASTKDETSYDEGQGDFSTSSGEAHELVDIVNIEQILWKKDAGRMEGGYDLPMVGDKVLAGKYSFKWGPIQLPETCTDRGQETRIPLPPSFYETANARFQIVHYYVKVSSVPGSHTSHTLLPRSLARGPLTYLYDLLSLACLMCMTLVRNFRIYAPFQFVPLPSPTPPSYQSQIFLNALRRGVMPPGPELEPNSWMTWRHEDEVKGTFGITSHGTLSTQFSIPKPCAFPYSMQIPFVLTFTPSSELHSYSSKHAQKPIVESIKFHLLAVVEHTAEGVTESERLERGEQVKWVECMVQDEAGKWEKRDLGGKDDEDGSRKDIQMEGREMKRVMLGWIPLKGNIAPSFKAHGLVLTSIIRLKIEVPGLGHSPKHEFPVDILSGFEDDGKTPKLYDLSSDYWDMKRMTWMN